MTALPADRACQSMSISIINHYARRRSPWLLLFVNIDHMLDDVSDVNTYWPLIFYCKYFHKKKLKNIFLHVWLNIIPKSKTWLILEVYLSRSIFAPWIKKIGTNNFRTQNYCTQHNVSKKNLVFLSRGFLIGSFVIIPAVWLYLTHDVDKSDYVMRKIYLCAWLRKLIQTNLYALNIWPSKKIELFFFFE